MSSVTSSCDNNAAANSINDDECADAESIHQTPCVLSPVYTNYTADYFTHFLSGSTVPNQATAYRNAAGLTEFVEVKYIGTDGKKFFQPFRFLPDSSTKNSLGYALGAKDYVAPLYRSDELAYNLRANHNHTVYITEGAKDADTLAMCGLLTTTNALGAGRWNDKHSRFLASLRAHRFVLLADNDKAGKKHMLSVARSLRQHIPHAEMKIVELPDLPEKGDVTDFFNGGGTLEQLHNAVDETPHWVSSATEPSKDAGLDAYAELPNPPLEILPANLGHYTSALAESMCADVNIVFATMLGFISGAIGRSYDVLIKQGWTEPTPLFISSVAPPGSLKSPVMKRLSKPIKDHDKTLADNYKSMRRDWDAKNAAYQKAKKSKTADNPVFDDPEPRRIHAFVTDSTIESMAEIMEHSKSMVYYLDELASLFNSMGCYKSGGKGSDRQFWTSCHNGAMAKVTRKSNKEVLCVMNPRIAVVGCTTPDVANSLHDDKAGDGLLDRIFFVIGRSVQRRFNAPSVPYDLEAEWCHRITSMLRLPDREEPLLLPLTPEAAQIFGAWWEANDPDKAPEGLSGVIGKAGGHLGRIATILTVYANPLAREINTDTIHTAIKVMEWLLAHTALQRQRMAGGKGFGLSTRAYKTLSRIKSKGGEAKVREVLAMNIKGIKNNSDVLEVFEELVGNGSGELFDYESTAGRTSLMFRVSA